MGSKVTNKKTVGREEKDVETYELSNPIKS